MMTADNPLDTKNENTKNQAPKSRAGNKLPTAIFLMGPTASGKTGLAIDLCTKLPCEIISVDSALIYKGMDIGTAKPSAAELNRAPHKLIDFLDPSQSYSVAQFRRDALSEMESISARGKIPLLVGGTMLYFKALLEGLAEMPESNAQIRKQIEAEAEQKGWPYMHALLAKVDSQSAARIHPNHSQRIERALGVYRATGKTMTSYHQQQGAKEVIPYHVIQLAIAPLDRKILHTRIEQRFQTMIKMGFVDEVTVLRQRADLDKELPSMRSVGYRQVWQHLDGELSFDEMIDRAIIATRQLAKRQFTWLKGWADLHWLHTNDQGLLVNSEQTGQYVEGLEGKPVIDLALRYINKFSA